MIKTEPRLTEKPTLVLLTAILLASVASTACIYCWSFETHFRRELSNWIIALGVGSLAVGIAAGLGIIWRRRRARFFNERCRATAALRELFDEVPVPYHEIDAAGIVRRVNRAECALLGFASDQIVGRPAWKLAAPDLQPESREAVRRKLSGEKPLAPYERRLVCRDGTEVWVEINETYVRNEAGEIEGIRTAMLNISDRKQVEAEREVTVRFLELVNGHNNLHGLMESVTQLLRDWAGCEAVGIRLKSGDDFPYFETRGFPAQFVQAESRLCQHDGNGKAVLDANGRPVLDCMCGNVLCGRFDPAKPFFTGMGSFWTNSTTDLLAGTTEADRQARTRNRCNREGYESVALLPMRVAGDTLGLLQMNDRRRNRFTPERIEFLERLANSLAITLAHRMANEEIRQNERKFRSYIDSAPMGVFVADQAGHFIEVNPAGNQMLGYSEGELLRLHVSDVLAPDDREAGMRRFAAVAEKGSSEAEAHLRRKDGAEFWVAIRAVNLAEHRFMAFVRDITEERKAHETLKESELRLKTLVEKAPVAISISRDGIGLQANQKLVQLLGLQDADAFAGRSVVGHFAPQRREVVIRHIRERSLGIPGDEEFESVLLRADGRQFPVHLATARIQLSDGTADMTIITDITERKEAEKALREGEARFAKIFRESPMPMAIRDLETGRYIDANDRCLSLTGYTLQDVLGRTPVEVGWMCEADGADVARLMRTDGIISDREVRVRRRDGTEVIWMYNTQIVGIGGQQCILSASVDITGRKNAEAALEQSEAQFRQAQKMEAVGQLAGGVAHDFNNILAAVLMYLGLLQEEPSMDPGTRASLKELERDVRRGTALVRQLLAFSRRQAMEPRIIDLKDLLQGLSKMLRRLLGENIELIFESSGELPPVKADAGMLEQIVMNLCVNSRDAMPRGGRLSLRLESVDISEEAAASNIEARTGRFLRLSVADTGCGMDAPTLQRIFEPFFTTKDAGKGTGLGLATVYGIVKQHQGWVEVQSAPGSGTTFLVYLPACDEAPESPDGAENPHGAPGGSETVLVVEDEDSLRAVTMAALRRHGYRVFGAADSGEARRIWEKHRTEIGLLFTDQVIPGDLTGRELAAMLRADKPGLKVMICTGYSQEITILASEEDARVAMLQKPFNVPQLLESVRRCLDSS